MKPLPLRFADRLKLPTNRSGEVRRAVVLFVLIEATLVGGILTAIFAVVEPSPLVFSVIGIGLTILVALPVNLQSCKAWMKLLDANQQLTWTSITDPLTQLPNRRAYSDRMTEVGTDDLVLALVDVDRFKRINDDFGHATGDEILVEVSHLLSFAMEGSGTVYRMGGDEFAIVGDAISSEHMHDILDATRETVAKLTFHAGSRPVRITISGGISHRRPGQSLDDLYRAADAALYGAKLAGRNNIWDDAPQGTGVPPLTVGDDLEWRPANRSG
ncbi:GGDEF domain-containing protein [Chthonobacter albigriseus]|uniref:GGDEF domain-containing protein n=1 Tax=Chthonobacter albigriseus TaxID=1683161 RepID=UPI0015EEBFCA|nr:GGDEF domain-containing protein [Chthonobacter albigriseus]